VQRYENVRNSLGLNYESPALTAELQARTRRNPRTWNSQCPTSNFHWHQRCVSTNDAGDPHFDPNAFDPPLIHDQRSSSYARVSNDGIHIGAFEVQ